MGEVFASLLSDPLTFGGSTRSTSSGSAGVLVLVGCGVSVSVGVGVAVKVGSGIVAVAVAVTEGVGIFVGSTRGDFVGLILDFDETGDAGKLGIIADSLN